MQLPHLEDLDCSTIPAETELSGGGLGRDGFEPEVRPGDHEPGPGDGRGGTCRVRLELEGAIDEPDRSPGTHPGDCVAYISQGEARYHLGDSGCEADYRAAFLLDVRFAPLEIVRRLNHDIWDDAASVLTNCRARLSLDGRDVVARIRLGLTLLLFHQDDEALRNLQQVFRQCPRWRPFLRLLVNEVRRRRAILFARIHRRR